MRHARGVSNFLHGRAMHRLNYFDVRHLDLPRAKNIDVRLNLSVV